VKFEQRSELVVRMGKAPASMWLYEPVTPAALAPYAAFGALAISATVLDSGGWRAAAGGSRTRILCGLDAGSFVASLGGEGRLHLQSMLPRWKLSAAAAFGAGLAKT